jgi:hypothetical protein
MIPWLALVALVAGSPEFLKGQLHLHTGNSGDSATPPVDVVRWYAARGYDFIVVTDHNVVTTAASTAAMLVIPGVELTQNLERCTPPPPAGMQCLLHVNALFVTPPRDGKLAWAAPGGPSRVQLYRRALATTRALGGIAQLNHPNFHHAADAALISTLAGDGLTLMEIANRSWDSNDVPADRGRPTTEALWDQALTLGANVFGTATDDAHHYFDAAAAGARGEPVFPGDLGFVMVRAAKQPAAIRDALARGDFYASTGVLLARVARVGGPVEKLELAVDARSPGPHSFTFIGASGRVLARSRGRAASFRLGDAPAGYVRVVVEDAHGRHAWVQPVRVSR